MRKLILALLLAPIVLLGCLVLVGLFSSSEHSVSRERSFDAKAQAVWTAITQFESYPDWRRAVSSVEILNARGQLDLEGVQFTETGEEGSMTFEVVSANPPARATPGSLVVRIADTSLGFGGTWTYRLTAQGDASSLLVTEDGFVTNFAYRMFSPFVSKTATMEKYLEDLADHVEGP